MSALRIVHSHEAGTLLEGSRKGDGVWEIVKRHGFAFFPSIKVIGIRQSRDQIAQRYRINAAAEALRAAGHDVEVDIDDTPRARGEALADRDDRLDTRADRLEAKAVRHAGAADAAHNRASEIAGRFEGGQPIILGHHSTRKALRDREKMQAADQRSHAEQAIADDAEYRASRVGKDAKRSATPTVTRRRIAVTESELRVIARDLEGWTQRFLRNDGTPYAIDKHPPASGNHRDMLLARQALLTERLTYDQAQLADAEAAGFVVWGPDNVHVGDLVKYWGGWKTVEKVNKVTLGCQSGHSWMDKVKFTDVITVKCTHGQPDEAAPVDDLTAPEADRLARMTASLAAGNLASTEAAHRLGVTFPTPTVHSHGLVGEGATVEATQPAISARAARDARIAAALAAPAVYAPGYFPTPPALAERVAQMLPAGPLTVLEPSAGDGALVRAVLDARPEATVVGVEPVLALCAMLGRISVGSDLRFRVSSCTFEEFGTNSSPDLFGAVVMNPPFSAPGHPALWAEHVARAYDHLRPGGRLVAIVPAGFAYRQDKTSTRVRDLVEVCGGGWEDLPEGTFKAAGTQVRTVLIWLTRPAAVAAGPFEQPSLLDVVKAAYNPATQRHRWEQTAVHHYRCVWCRLERRNRELAQASVAYGATSRSAGWETRWTTADGNMTSSAAGAKQPKCPGPVASP